MYRDEKYDLKVEIDTENYQLSDEEMEKIQADLDNLRRLVADFPVSELHIRIDRNPRSEVIHVKTSLRFPKQTLFTGERRGTMYPAFNRCIRKLMQKVKSFKEKLSQKPIHEKVVEGKHHEVRPEREPDAEKLAAAAEKRNYSLFREALRVYDDPLQKRIGRWIERYPAVAGELGNELTISDILEEVYLNAFESFLERPSDRLGNWLESLIDPSVRALVEEPRIAREEVKYAEEIAEKEEEEG